MPWIWKCRECAVLFLLFPSAFLLHHIFLKSSFFLLVDIAVLDSLNLSWNCSADFIVVVHILFARKRVGHFDVPKMVCISLDNCLLQLVLLCTLWMCMRSVMKNHRQSYDLRICADYVLISESSWYTRGGVRTIQPMTGSPVILVLPITSFS